MKKGNEKRYAVCLFNYVLFDIGSLRKLYAQRYANVYPELP